MQLKYSAFIAALFLAGFQFCFCAHISPTTANQIIAARLLAGGKAIFSDFYFDDLPGFVFFRLWQTHFADFLRTLSLPSCPLWGGDTVGTPASYFGAFPVAHADVLAQFFFLLVFQTVILAFICRFSKLPLMFFAVLFSMLSFPFQFASAQHYLLLSLLPLIFLLTSKNLGNGLSTLALYFAAILAALVSSLSIWFLPLPYILILGAFLQSPLTLRSKWLQFLPLILVCLFVESLALYGQWQSIGAAGRQAVCDWIWTFRRSTLFMEDMTVFGYESSVDRRDLVYLFALLLPLSLSLTKRLPFTVPFVLLSVCGMGLYMCSSSYLSDSLVLSSAALYTLLLYCTVTAFYRLPRHYPRFFPFLFRRSLLYGLISAAVIAFVVSPVYCLYQMTKEIESCQPADLRSALLNLTKTGDKVLILTGRLTPACPELLLTGRRAVGYFINGEPIGMLINYLRHKADGTWLEREPQFVKEKVAVLVERLRQDILAEEPDYILVEGGDLDTFLHEQGIYLLIERHYKQVEFCNWQSKNTGPREFSDWNYDMAIYKRKEI